MIPLYHHLRVLLATSLLFVLVSACGRGEDGRAGGRLRGGERVRDDDSTPQRGVEQARTIGEIPVPPGYRRRRLDNEAFGVWLRSCPLLPGRREVLLYNGEPKGNQSAHAAVLAMDVGRSDLQQCADAVMRLRAEYLFARGRFDEIAFDLTNGDRVDYARWRAGQRPRLSGNTIRWAASASPDMSHETFRSWLDFIFTYAGTASLSHELHAVPPEEIEPGDVFIKGGFPGHAVIVVDVVENERTGERLFMLAQSYMPAQQIHILRNPRDSELSPWYRVEPDRNLETPEWVFKGCAPMRW